MASTRATRAAGLVSLAALAVVSLLVVRTSSAAFTVATANEGNSFVAGDVTLDDDAPASSALFTETGFAAGQAAVECIAVTYAGTITDPGQVHLYAGGFTDVPGPLEGSVGLSDHLRLTIEEGTGASFGSCGGFTPTSTLVSDVTLRAFGTSRTDYASGVGSWDPASSPVTRSYRFTMRLDETSVPNEEQGAATRDLSFVWEITS